MANYKQAIQWCALNDGAGDTSSGVDWDSAFEFAHQTVTFFLVADLFGKSDEDVTADVLKARGFKKPRGWKHQDA